MSLLTGRQETSPVPVIRQSRRIPMKGVTTLKPGKFHPILAYNLLREGSSQGRISFAVEMRETHELLLNEVRMRVTSWFVPHVALPRFEKNPMFFQKSYAGEEPMAGKSVIPFIRQHAFGTAGSNEVYKALGLVATMGQMVNTSYLESYNAVWDYVAENRSKDLTLRTDMQSTIAPAFWGPNNASEIVPDFDDGLIAGEVPLSIRDYYSPVKGIGKVNETFSRTNVTGMRVSGTPTTVTFGKAAGINDGVTNDQFFIEEDPAIPGRPAIFTEMAENSIMVSLANLDQAKKLASWARLRERYEGHSEEWIIDGLMQGFHIEDLEFMHPIQLDQVTVKFKQGLRYASNAPDLNEHATNGVAAGSIGVNMPPNIYGGVIMVIAEIVPEQIMETQPDPWFMAETVDDLPNYFQDVNNPMPVEEVKNKHVDAIHGQPNGLFGWARRNWRWLKWPTRVGGDLYMHNPTAATTEARRAIWPTYVQDAALSEEFYLSTTLGVQPFMDTSRDQFTFSYNGDVGITDLTLIGSVHESEGNYDIVRNQIAPLANPKV